MWGELVEIDDKAVRRFEYVDDKAETARQDELSEALRAVAVENEPNPAKLKWNC